jgi:hypothetical protein
MAKAVPGTAPPAGSLDAKLMSRGAGGIMHRVTMIHCKEPSDKVERLVTIYEDGTSGPEVHIEFADGATFSACLKANVSIEAKYIHDQGGEPCILRDSSMPAIPP